MAPEMSDHAAARLEMTCDRCELRRRLPRPSVARSPTHHEAKRDQGQARNGAAEPDEFAIGDEDDGEILKDGVDGDGEVLLRCEIGSTAGGGAKRASETIAHARAGLCTHEGLGARVDDRDEKEGDREPFARVVLVQVAEGDELGAVEPSVSAVRSVKVKHGLGMCGSTLAMLGRESETYSYAF